MVRRTMTIDRVTFSPLRRGGLTAVLFQIRYSRPRDVLTAPSLRAQGNSAHGSSHSPEQPPPIISANEGPERPLPYSIPRLASSTRTRTSNASRSAPKAGRAPASLSSGPRASSFN